LQAAEPVAKVPAGHVVTRKMHDGAPAVLYVPAPQGVQLERPAEGLNVPCAMARARARM